MRIVIVIALIVLFFGIGWASGQVIHEGNVVTQQPVAIFSTSIEKSSPYDWIPERSIHVYPDKVVIDIENPVWARFADTKSMDPVFDKGANAIEFVPTSPEQIHVGDIVSYESEYANGSVIHRVVQIGSDGEWYMRTKGDNNSAIDPGKIRFEQVRRILVAVIY